MRPLDSLFADVRTLALEHLRQVDGVMIAPTNLPRLVESLGIRLRSEPFLDAPEFTGVAVLVPTEDLRLIIVNELLLPPQWAHTVAHELGHLVLEHTPPRRQIIEQLADAYAREVLMPFPRLVNQIRTYGSNEAYLAGLNGVPVAAMCRRLRELAISAAYGEWQMILNQSQSAPVEVVQSAS